MNLEEQNNLKIPSDAQNSSASDPPVPAFIGITERKRTEEALQQAHDELEARVAQRTEELWRANEQLRAEVAERQREEEKACDSQRLLQKIIDSSPSLIYLMDLEGRFLMSNQMFGQLFGISPHTLIGKGREIIVAKEFAEEHRNNDLEVIQTRKAISFEEDNMESDGLHTYSSKKFPLFDATGNVYAVCGISDDITELKRRERDREQTSHLLQLLNTPGDFLERISELTASLQKWSGCEAIGLRLRAGDDFPYYETRGFPSAFVQAENHLCACDSHGNLLRDGDGNPVLECMCGNVLCGRFDPVKPFFTAHGSFWSNNTTALLASTSEADRQARTRNRCNVEGYESVALIPLRFGGQVFGLIQFNDHRPDCFTPKSIEQFERMADKLAIGLSRRQAEEMLRRSEQEFRILAEAMPQIVWATRPDGWNIYFNKQWVDYTGLTMEESYGHGWIAPFHPDDRQRAWDAWQHSTQQDNPYALECRLRRFDGAYRWWLIRGVPLRNATGEILKWFGTCTDIQDIKQSELEKEALEAQNRQLQKSESLGRMAGAIAHHFNNQLQAVMMNLWVAMKNLPAGSGHVENLTEAMQSARKAAEVSTLMLTYLGLTVTKRELLDFSDICQQSLPMLRAVMPKDVLLETDLPMPGPVVQANANQMQQVLTNLVTNACEACANGRGTVRLTLKIVNSAKIPTANRFPVDWQPQQNDYACLDVIDFGCGIAPQDIDKLFDPFFSSKFVGRGLGLPVVLGIVRGHGGVITVKSEPSLGSVFRVFLPLSEKAAPQKPISMVQEPKTGWSGTVLVVDDEANLRKVVATAIKSLGFAVVEAQDGVQAVDMFRQHQGEIRLVLCDLTMPRMDGWQTLSALRKLSPCIPVILASGYSEAQVMAGNHPELPQAFLSKPYEFETLRDAISRVLALMER